MKGDQLPKCQLPGEDELCAEIDDENNGETVQQFANRVIGDIELCNPPLLEQR